MFINYCFQYSNGNLTKMNWEGKSRNWKGKLRLKSDGGSRRPGKTYLVYLASSFRCRVPKKSFCTFVTMLGWLRKGGRRRRKPAVVSRRRKPRDASPRSRNRRDSRPSGNSRRKDGRPNVLGTSNWPRSRSNFFFVFFFCVSNPPSTLRIESRMSVESPFSQPRN